MKNLLVAIVVVLAGIAVLGFYRGWFHVSTQDAEHKTNITISVDKTKIADDEQKLKDKEHSLMKQAGKANP